MNVVNRILVVISILVWLALGAALLLDPLFSVEVANTYLEQFRQAVFDNQFYMYFVIGVAVLLFVLLILLWLELRRPRKKTAKIKIKGGGTAQLEISSVAQSLEYRIDELAGVRKVRPRITSRGRDVAVRVDLDTSPSVNIPVLTSQIVDMTHDIIEGQLGVKIHGKVEINVKHEPYPRGTMAPTGPLGEDAIAPPPVLEEAAVANGGASPRKANGVAPRPVIEPRPVVITPAPQGEAPVEETEDTGKTNDW